MGAVGSQGGRLDQQVQDGRDHLLSDNWGVDFNGWEMRMSKHHWNVEAANVGVIVWGDASIIWEGETTVWLVDDASDHRGQLTDHQPSRAMSR